VVVRVFRLPVELDVAALGLEELEHLRPFLDEALEALGRHPARGDRPEVLEHALGRVVVAGAPDRRRVGDPDAAAGERGRPAEEVGLLHEQDVQARGLGRQRGDDPAPAGADDEYVELLIECLRRRAHGVSRIGGGRVSRISLRQPTVR
jgi:hypothetical protein